MKLAKLNEAAHKHIVLGELIASVKRIVKAWQIWRINCQYLAQGEDLNCCAEAMKELDWYRAEIIRTQEAAKEKRAALLLRRGNLRVAMLELGGH
jgi:hypothetical protein